MGFLVHRDFADDVSVHEFCSRSASIWIHNGAKRILCITSHLPTGPTTIEHMNNFEYHMDVLDKMVARRIRHPVFIGMDANAVIGCQGQDADALLHP